jgi:hypothetical protein
LILRRMLVKKSVARLHYDDNDAVLHVFPDEAGAENRVHTGFWLHIGFGNLRTGDFEFTVLVPDSDSLQVSRGLSLAWSSQSVFCFLISRAPDFGIAYPLKRYAHASAVNPTVHTVHGRCFI